MGLYNDFSNTNRTDWEFPYTGAEMLIAARTKYREYHAKERAAREQMAQLMMDMSIAQSDGRIAECKKEIEKSGTERERCAVWMSEFARRPDAVYELGLGDVTYFDLAPEPKEAT